MAAPVPLDQGRGVAPALAVESHSPSREADSFLYRLRRLSTPFQTPNLRRPRCSSAMLSVTATYAHSRGICATVALISGVPATDSESYAGMAIDPTSARSMP